MSFDFSGYVIQAARVANSNANTTSSINTGVSRDWKAVPGAFDLSGQAPALVEARADQYRSAILQKTNQEVEYLIYAANSSQLSIVEDASWVLSEATVSIPTGELTVTNLLGSPATYGDGSSRLVVVDNGNRTIAGIVSLKVTRGDSGAEITCVFTQDADAGLVTLDGATLTALGGGVSALRGDTITEIYYYLAASRFWWTRNDPAQKRFGWNGRSQRWEPLRGGSPVHLGLLNSSGSYILSPRPSGITEGDFLPGSTTGDAYSMVRLGSVPDANSTPIVERIAPAPFSGIYVVSDEVAGTTYDFSVASPPYAAVIGIGSGIIQWNSDFLNANAGQSVWYVPQEFSGDTGSVGRLLDGSLFIAPIPFHTDRPLIRIGFRRYLSVKYANTDAELAVLSVSSGEVGVSLTTGKLKFSDADINKSDPDHNDFDVQYLDVQVYYDGVTLNQESQPTKDPVRLVNAGGSPEVISLSNVLYVPDGQDLPGLGVSGVLHVPDGTGATPTTGTPSVRPGGDDPGDTTTGLIRDPLSTGDVFLFTRLGIIENLIVVDRIADLPSFDFEIEKGTAYIAKEKQVGDPGSRIALSYQDRVDFSGEYLYFIQADLLPAVYTAEAKVYSQVRDEVLFDGTEILHFAVDGMGYEWASSLLSPGSSPIPMDTVSASIDSVITGSGQAYAQSGRLCIEAGDPTTGSVEIGFGKNNIKDLSGCVALGLLPGWRVVGGQDNWLVDSGVGFGLHRSPVNLDGSRSESDFKSIARIEDHILSDSIPAIPYLFLDRPPLEDVAGYDESVFFQLSTIIRKGNTTQVVNIPLKNYAELIYQFDQDRIGWLEEQRVTSPIQQPTQAISLEKNLVVPGSLLSKVGGFFNIASSGSSFVSQTLGEDYIIPDNGDAGIAYLVDRIGSRVASGGRGSYTADSTTFTDPTASFITDNVSSSYWLKILVGSGYWYQISSITSETSLELDLDFTESSTTPISWEIYEGYADTVYDPLLIADHTFTEFNHLSEEPFSIRLLSQVGTVPTDIATQNASRNVGLFADALESGRTTTLRMGLDGSEISLSALTRQNLGEMTNGSLFVPNTTASRFTDQAFSIQVGTQKFSHGGGLIPVGAFSVPIGVSDIEYLTTTGELGFGSNVLSNYAMSEVWYVEEFQTPTLLGEGSAEYDSDTGEINYANADLVTYGGVNSYLVEKLITENRLDVVISPLIGAFHFNKPLRSGMIVEVSYFQADSAGAKLLDGDGNPITVTEFLPLYVRLEEATRVTKQKYSFNPLGKTLFSNIDPEVYVDITLRNYGGENTAGIDFETSEITFPTAVDIDSTVRISYAVLEAFGGETSYTSSVTPIYRPPFFVQKDSETFVLDGDRTSEMAAGKLLRIGDTPLYLQSSVYDAASDQTTVTVFPTPDKELGSRAPGNDIISLLSSRPVTDLVGAVSVSGVATGFWLSILSNHDPLEKKASQVRFAGDLRQFAVPGHMLDMGGYPFIISDATLSDDGLYTVISTTTGSPIQLESVSCKISARPIYPPNPRDFLGVGPQVTSGFSQIPAVLPSEEFDVFLVEDGSPGQSLRLGVDYSIDFSNGQIRLLDPVQNPLAGNQKLYIRYTKLRTLSPFMQQGSVIFPRYDAKFSFVTVPTDQNGLLGGTIKATYTFRNPDSFYTRVVPLLTHAGDVGAKILSSGSSQTGPVVSTGYSTENHESGRVSFLAERTVLTNQDRVGRSYLSFYNNCVVAFEQVLETISGEIVGDRDGKFRFKVGKGEDIPLPGYEDDLTGLINPRNLWTEVFASANALNNFIVTQDDPIVHPLSATLSSGDITGYFPDATILEQLIRMQLDLIQNDVDDLLLVAPKEITLQYIFPLLRQVALGDFRRMGEPHQYSRLFPESTKAFMTTFPGIGATSTDNGAYSWSKTIDPPGFSFDTDTSPINVSTHGKTIAKISNPVQGVIENVSDIVVFDRVPRARIWGYSPTGYPSLDSNTTNKPTILATPLPLKDLPIDSATGLPDTTKLVSEGGTLKDLVSGDYDLHVPGFQGFDPVYQVAFGQPSGKTYDVGYSDQVLSINGATRLSGVYIDQIYKGCLITLKSIDSLGGDISISDPNKLIRLNADLSTGDVFSAIQGETIYLSSPTGSPVETQDPPTKEDLERLASGLASYRVNFDLAVRGREGELVDISLPSFYDPSFFGIKELFGQKSPKPVSNLEAQVKFVSATEEPLKIPALLGQSTDDSGDYSIPYLSTVNTELDRFSGAEDGMRKILETKSVDGTLYVYPDEIFGSDGDILSVFSGTIPPATLITSQDVLPVTNGSTDSGVGDMQAYDLLLVEVEDAATSIQLGSQGILSVGAVSWNAGDAVSQIEPPRFVTQTRFGDRIRYLFNNAMAHISGGVTGAVVTDDGVNTTLDISSVAGLVFNDGVGSAVAGGLNNIVSNSIKAYPNTNRITITLYNNDGSLRETILIRGSQVTGGAGSGVLISVPTFSDKILTLSGVTGILSTVPVGPGQGPIDFTISIDTTDAFANGPDCGSDTGWIDTDRLTFKEAFDLSSTLVRNSVTGLGLNTQAELGVYTVSGPGSSDITVNDPTEVNGGVLFTFLERSAGTIGSFVVASGSGNGDEVGSVKVMGWEGFVNDPITPVSGTFRFAGIPSSRKDDTTPDALGTICVGEGQCDATSSLNNRIHAITESAGDVSKVQKGDIVAITKAAGGAEEATTKAGTYLVRHAVDANVGNTYREVELSASAGSNSGWARIQFPTLVSFDSGANTLTISDLILLSDSPTTHAFPATGRVYVVVNAGDLRSLTASTYANSVVSAAYTGIVIGTKTFTGLSDYRDASNAAITSAVFESLISAGDIISGMMFVDLVPGGSGLPDNNVVGMDDANAVYGFRYITVQNLGIDAANVVNYELPAGDIAKVTASGVLAVTSATPTASTSFVSSVDTPIYDNVASLLDIRGITSAQWKRLHHPAGNAGLVECLVPGDQLVTKSSIGDPGFRAQAGIFLEPSFPRPIFDLSGGVQHLVDASRSLAPSAIGFRDAATFGAVGPESVAFEVRRIRRFHDVLNTVGNNLSPLRFAYEIRRGTVTGHTTGTKQTDTLTATGATQLGLFTNPDVGLHTGATFRLLDNNGDLLEETKILSVKSGTELILSPSLKTTPVVGKDFEIYIHEGPVPHEQSNEELLTLMTGATIFERSADYTTQEGGYVPANWADRNKLYDDLITGVGNNTFAALGVSVDDIVIVDPAGTLSGPTGQPAIIETGARPFGDQSIQERSGPTWVADEPLELDDNRGWYRVLQVNSDHLVVSPETEFTSSVDPYKIFPTDASQQATYGYAVYPTIRNSTLSGGDEGQMDLRPTSKAGENGSPLNSFAGNQFSIRPFSYKIIRPSALFSTETVDLILMMRERMLSWIEHLGTATYGLKQGSYFEFQRDEHAEELGDLNNLGLGKGILQNALIQDLRGVVSISPFANDKDCLSILDRRFWIFDSRLDALKPQPASLNTYTSMTTPGAGSSVRPVLPDRIKIALDQRDRFRQLRYSWLSFRVHRQKGILSQIDRFDAELPKREQEQRDLVLRIESSNKAGS